MKNLYKLSAFFFLALFLSSCVDLSDCVRGEGPVITEEYRLGNFDGIKLLCSADIELRQGNTFNVEVQAQPNIQDAMLVEVRNGILEIDFIDCIRSSRDLVVFVTMPELVYLEVDGSGDVNSRGLIEANDIDLVVDGSGDIDLRLDADDVNIDIRGSGDITLDGDADDVNLDIRASGNLNGFDFYTSDMRISVDGSGDAKVQVDDYLEADIFGSGDVYFKGFPFLDVNIVGSGELIDAN